MLNSIVAVVLLAVTLAVPVRGLLSSRDLAAEAEARGEVVFNARDRNAGARSTQYILLFLFGSLTLVYAWRALKPAKSGDPSRIRAADPALQDAPDGER